MLCLERLKRIIASSIGGFLAYSMQVMRLVGDKQNKVRLL